MTTKTVDLKQSLKHLYKPSAKQPEIVSVPPLQFLMIDGKGDPDSDVFKNAVSAIYSAAYTLKFAFKKGRGIDYPVMPSEGLWWADDMNDFMAAERANWLWTIMILQPELVTEADAAQAVADAKAKKRLPDFDRIRLESFHEGDAAQILHIGSYDAEAPTIARLHQFIEAQGYQLSGKHHEIYLSDPRRSTPENLKTIIRQPVRPR